MDKLNPKQDGASLDIVQDNIDKLRELFPDAFTEGSDWDGPRWKVDFDALRKILGDYIEDERERYSFTWHGKARARQIAQTPSAGTLRPCPEESVNWDTTRNLFIEGDNLEVLKLLQKSYHKQVKMIYIDPPYNTGGEFIYPDRFQDNLDTYLRYTGQIDDQGLKVSANSESSGRYHTNWLNMMYPRLRLARNLLREDGVIFVSINDVEAPNIRKILDEIYGEENFVSQVVWQRTRRGDAKLIANNHEYIVCYAKNIHATIEAGLWRRPKEGVEEVLEKYEEVKKRFGGNHDRIRKEMQSWYRSLPDGDPRKSHKHYNWSDDRGLYFAADFSGPDDGRANRPRHDILHPVTGRPCRKPSTGWRWDKERTEWALNQYPSRIHFGLDESTIPNRKSYLNEVSVEPFGSVFYKDGRSATLQVERLVGSGEFPFPKNSEVIRELIDIVCGDDDFVLDFFAGSGTTGHAVIESNVRMKKKRRFLLVQLQEPTNSASYKDISKLGMARLRSAIKESERDGAENSKGLGLGFRAFSLSASNIRPWDPTAYDLSASLFDYIENIKSDRTESDVLYELLLKYGLDLVVPIEEREIAGKAVYITGAGALVVCLGDNIGLEVVNGIASLKDELTPEVMRVVFRDAGFTNDVVKTNAVQILLQAGIEDVKSL
ncbi:site-specific DNA-methyltransferase [Aquisalimonas sp. 2447]|uniref:site-specific DNA-methyltransferase n=1 Tax=Aquisalimonas sp. 2447 TaxID=2740807 RepID=UPI0014324772|nr:site-specific DNA-methyltransferase [Aquisalimonas sp. 2447]QIT55021.1 site-specific DNA-methyltransferase [Aquisalimonas sp. 2447]